MTTPNLPPRNDSANRALVEAYKADRPRDPFDNPNAWRALDPFPEGSKPERIEISPGRALLASLGVGIALGLIGERIARSVADWLTAPF